MATEVGSQSRQAPKYETFVETQIARARARIRALDAAAIGLALLLAALAYCLVMTFLDQAFDLPAGARLAAFLVFAAGAAVYLGIATFRLLSRRVNPYYAARQIEQTLPDAKNSVVNWLDLRTANLPPAIRGALGQRAARDLKQADLDRAISTRRTTWLGTAASVLFIVLLVWLVLGGGQAFSLLQRAFAPFQEVAIASRTELTLLQPEGGDVTVPLGRPVNVRVHVTGRVPRVNEPDALRLYYRYNPTDPYVEQNLEQEADGEWATTLVADQVQSGLWYLIRGGDAQTPEYQVRVRAQAQVSGFDVEYHYPAYLHRADQTVHYPNEDAVAPHLRGQRGTEVTLTARANRPVRDGQVEMDLGGVKKELAAEMIQPETMRFHFLLDQSGTYRVLFTGTDRDSNTDRSPYRIEVLADRPPLVKLTRPGKDVELPTNGTLSLEGQAEDDFGITKMILRLQVKEGPALRAKVYREGKSFRLDNGNYPDKLDYKDFVALEKVQTDAGTPFALAPGMEVKYWLEATDNCDYPDKNGNVGRSKDYTVKIVEASSRSQQQQQRKQAQQAQQQHEQRQDQKLEDQNEAAKAGQQEGAGVNEQNGSEQNKSPSQKEFENKANQLAKAIQDKEKQDAGKSQSSGDSKSEASNKQNGQDNKGSNPGAAQEQQGGAGNGDQKEKDQKGESASDNQPNDQKQSQAGKGQQQQQGSESGAAKGTNGAQREQNQKGESSSGNQANDQKQSQASKDKQQQGKESGATREPQASQNQNQKQGENAAGKETQPGKNQEQKQGQTDTGKENQGAKNQEQKQRDGNAAQTGKNQEQKQPDGGAGKETQTAKQQDQKQNQAPAGKEKTQAQDSAAGKDTAQSQSQGGNPVKDNTQAQTKQDGKEQGAKGETGGTKNEASAGNSPKGTNAKANPQDQSSDAKANSQANAPDAKQQPSAGQQGSASQDKSGGQPQDGKEQGTQEPSKGQQGAQTKETAKSNVNQTAAGQQQNTSAQSGAGQPNNSKTPSGKSQNAEGAKGKRPSSASAGKEKSSSQDATMDDVTRLKESLKNGQQQKQAADDLSRVRAEARDPQVRKAAEDALKEAGAQARESARNASKEDVSKLAEDLKSTEQKQAAADALSKIASEARNPQARKAAEEALKQADSTSAKAQEKNAGMGDKGQPNSAGSAQAKSENQPDASGQPSAKGDAKEMKPGAAKAKPENGPGPTPAQGQAGNQGNPGGNTRSGQATAAGEKSQPQAVNEEFARRGGVLQLEDLKKKVTPDILKKLNWSDKDWQQFLEQARRYEVQQKQPPLTAKDRLPSGSGLLPSTGPRQVRPGTDARSDDISTGRALPPPEYREAQNIFTSRPEGKK